MPVDLVRGAQISTGGMCSVLDRRRQVGLGYLETRPEFLLIFDAEGKWLGKLEPAASAGEALARAVFEARRHRIETVKRDHRGAETIRDDWLIQLRGGIGDVPGGEPRGRSILSATYQESGLGGPRPSICGAGPERVLGAITMLPPYERPDIATALPKHWIGTAGARDVKTEYFKRALVAAHQAIKDCGLLALEGEPGLGKTFAIMSVAERLHFPYHYLECPPGIPRRFRVVAILRVIGWPHDPQESLAILLDDLVAACASEKRVLVWTRFTAGARMESISSGICGASPRTSPRSSSWARRSRG